MTPWYQNKKLMHFTITSLIIIILSALLYFDGRKKKWHSKKEIVIGVEKKWKQKKSRWEKGTQRDTPANAEPVPLSKVFLANPKKKNVKRAAAKDTSALIPALAKKRILQTVPPVKKAQDYRTVKLEIRAYCPCRKCCSRWYKYRQTAYTQRKLWPNDKVIATAGTLPVGALVFVPGYGKYRVEDRGTVNEIFFYLPEDGRGIKKDYPASHKAALRWGVKRLEVKIYEERKQ